MSGAGECPESRRWGPQAPGPAVVALLEKFDILTGALPGWREVVLRNHRGEVIGKLGARGFN